jgi:uncharacterized membrane protein YidH (DUF202 family)
VPSAALTNHHHTPSGLLLFVLIVIAILYVTWRTGNLGRLRNGLRATRLRSDLRDQRISPFTLMPLALLVIVVVVLLVAH